VGVFIVALGLTDSTVTLSSSPSKLEVSVREDLVFAVRDALIGLSEVGLSVFSVPAVAKVELVAEKLRALA
jgi:hypothetical protein